MATSEERMKILKMIQEGKLTAEEAAQLMEALEDRRSSSSSADVPPEGTVPGGSKNPEMVPGAGDGYRIRAGQG